MSVGLLSSRFLNQALHLLHHISAEVTGWRAQHLNKALRIKLWDDSSNSRAWRGHIGKGKHEYGKITERKDVRRTMWQTERDHARPPTTAQIDTGKAQLLLKLSLKQLWWMWERAVKGGKITSDLKRTNMRCWHGTIQCALLFLFHPRCLYAVVKLENSTSLCRIFACFHGSVNERPRTGTSGLWFRKN